MAQVYRRFRRRHDGFSISSWEEQSISRSTLSSYSLAQVSAIAMVKVPVVLSDLPHLEFYRRAPIHPTNPVSAHDPGSLSQHRQVDIQPAPSSMELRRVNARDKASVVACSEEVIGQWAKFTKRVWVARKFVFELQFESPEFSVVV